MPIYDSSKARKLFSVFVYLCYPLPFVDLFDGMMMLNRSFHHVNNEILYHNHTRE